MLKHSRCDIGFFWKKKPSEKIKLYKLRVLFLSWKWDHSGHVYFILYIYIESLKVKKCVRHFSQVSFNIIWHPFSSYKSNQLNSGPTISYLSGTISVTMAISVFEMTDDVICHRENMWMERMQNKFGWDTEHWQIYRT